MTAGTHEPDAAGWSLLAARWDELFPVRPARVAMCLHRTMPGDSVLDAGCATGGLVHALLEAGRDARGLDLDAGFVAEARHRLGAHGDRIVQGDLRDLAAATGGRSFALIACLGQTFPHLLDDDGVRGFLAGARDRLAPGGRLLVQVVSDAGAPEARDLPSLRAGDLALERRRILVNAGRARLELALRAPGLERGWSVEHRRWTPESLAGFAASCGLAQTAVMADEAGSPWTGREAGWILELAAKEAAPR